MTLRRPRALLLAIFALALLPTAVALGAASNIDISRAIYAGVSPEKVKKASHVWFTVDLAKDTNRNGRVARAVVFRFARGFKVNRGAVPGRCSGGQARSFSCPSDSQIGAASLVTAVDNGARKVTSKVKLFLATTKQGTSGPVAADVRTAGHRRSTTGRLVRINDPVYAYEFRLDGLSGATGGHVERLRATIGSTRGGGTLVRNPSICSGGWHYGVSVVYTDGAVHRGDGIVSCLEG